MVTGPVRARTAFAALLGSPEALPNEADGACCEQEAGGRIEFDQESVTFVAACARWWGLTMVEIDWRAGDKRPRCSFSAACNAFRGT